MGSVRAFSHHTPPSANRKARCALPARGQRHALPGRCREKQAALRRGKSAGLPKRVGLSPHQGGRPEVSGDTPLPPSRATEGIVSRRRPTFAFKCHRAGSTRSCRRRAYIASNRHAVNVENCRQARQSRHRRYRRPGRNAPGRKVPSDNFCPNPCPPRGASSRIPEMTGSAMEGALRVR